MNSFLCLFDLVFCFVENFFNFSIKSNVKCVVYFDVCFFFNLELGYICVEILVYFKYILNLMWFLSVVKKWFLVLKFFKYKEEKDMFIGKNICILILKKFCEKVL